MQECSALLEFLLCNHAGFKIVPGSFCEDSVFLDIITVNSGFTIALEAALFAGGLSCFAAV